MQYVNAASSDLRQVHKDDYLRMISATYALDGDLAAAKKRLSKFGVSLSVQKFNNLISQEKRPGDSPSQNALVQFARALGFETILSSQLKSTEAETSDVSAKPTAVVSSFRLIERTPLTCVEEPNEAILRIYVRNGQGRDLPNIAIQIRWTDGDDTVITGLKPERGSGYADFEAEPGAYVVSVANAPGDVASRLTIGEAPRNCRDDRGLTTRGWKLVFQQK